MMSEAAAPFPFSLRQSRRLLGCNLSGPVSNYAASDSGSRLCSFFFSQIRACLARYWTGQVEVAMLSGKEDFPIGAGATPCQRRVSRLQKTMPASRLTLRETVGMARAPSLFVSNPPIPVDRTIWAWRGPGVGLVWWSHALVGHGMPLLGPEISPASAQKRHGGQELRADCCRPAGSWSGASTPLPFSGPPDLQASLPFPTHFPSPKTYGGQGFRDPGLQGLLEVASRHSQRPSQPALCCVHASLRCCPPWRPQLSGVKPERPESPASQPRLSWFLH